MKNTYIIGEIGQNHNGSVDLAKLIIELISRPVHEDVFGMDFMPMNAVKMTKRDLSEELAVSQMNQIYDNPNSFGRTYGEHRAFLELDDQAHFEIYKYAKSLGLDFIETLCAKGETLIPIILSTGMAGQRELDNALDVITRYHSNIAILHCVSQYPTHPNNLNLRTITYLKKHYNKFEIGFSDHTIGISAATAAVAMGAEIIEKHVTIDRHMKGTDQLGSLGPDGVNRMIRDIRIAECWLGTEDLYIEKGVEKSKIKLERSIATRKYIPAGSIIQESDIHLLSPGDGYKWIDKKNVIGHFAKQDISANEIIYPDFIE